MVKNYILDTNILMQTEGDALYGFGDNNVIVTGITLAELDKHKTSPGEAGAQARHAIKKLDEIKNGIEIPPVLLETEDEEVEEKPKKRKSSTTKTKTAKKSENKSSDEKYNVVARYISEQLRTGVKLKNGGTFRVILDYNDEGIELPAGFDAKKPDNMIIVTALYLAKSQKERTILVTNDVSMNFCATAVGMETQYYKNETVSLLERYTGRDEIEVPKSVIDTIYDKKVIDVPSGIEDDFFENEYVSFVSPRSDGKNDSVLTCYRNKKFYKINTEVSLSGGVKARNCGQHYAIDTFMTPASEQPLSIVMGPAGTGKTFLALAAALEQVDLGGTYYSSDDYDDKDSGKKKSGKKNKKKNTSSKKTKCGSYKRIIITRANVTADADFGYLPGDIGNKMDPLLKPFFDNLVNLLGRDSDESIKELEAEAQEMLDSGLITITPLSYIRGRSISNAYIIIDECQNMTPNLMKTVVTRAGDNTKIILLGDPDQIDTPKLSKNHNGLVYISEKMKGQKECGQLTFYNSECVRSPLAKLAAEIL